MKTSEIFIDVEIPPVHLHALNKPILGIFKQLMLAVDIINKNWIYFFAAGVLLLVLLFFPFVDWLYAR